MACEFFQEQREQSQIKAKIVSKYFGVWANIILSAQRSRPQHSQRMAYVDLFAGPGRYNDQSKSTPVLVLETILSKPELINRVITLFNDKDAENIENLKRTIAAISGIENLKYTPEFFNEEVGSRVVELFNNQSLVPTFFFVDPWGYKGLSLDLVSSIIKHWGCDCVFFFNYNRVNMGISNEAVKDHMSSLFGEDRLDCLRNMLANTNSSFEREMLVVQELCEALRQSGSKYVLPFRFMNDNGTRTSHHLIFLSKHFLGYDKMKEIMAKESSDAIQGVASFEYNPFDKFYKQGTLFDLLSRPLDELQGMLISKYQGQTIDFMDLYKEHSVNRPYIRKNYKDALRIMLDIGLIYAVNPKNNEPPRRGTFSDDMRITFLTEGEPSRPTWDL